MFSNIQEKGHKLFSYIRLRFIFGKRNEFNRIHPELVHLWRKKFAQMIKYSWLRVWEIADEFLNAKIELVKKSDLLFDSSTPTLLCVLKNDIAKIKLFMQHYRELGVVNFVFLDNMSTDGTYEFLLEQEDVTIYRCEHSFTADRKVAWLNRLIAELGLNRWYLMVDSDEFFSYQGYKEHNINQFIEKVSKKGIKRVGVIHLDMYPKGKLFNNDSNMNFMDEYCYFDKDTYTFKNAHSVIYMRGGPRKRAFGMNMSLSGVRMVYFEADDIVPSAHFMLPYLKEGITPIYLVSRHYKFVDESDYNKMLEAVQTGMHYNNSVGYRAYLDVLTKNPDLSLYDEGHSLLFSEENLKVFSFLETLF